MPLLACDEQARRRILDRETMRRVWEVNYDDIETLEALDDALRALD